MRVRVLFLTATVDNCSQFSVIRESISLMPSWCMIHLNISADENGQEQTSITFPSFPIALSSYKILFLIKIICFLQRNNNGCRVTSNCMDAVPKRFKRMPGRRTALMLVGYTWHNEQYYTVHFLSCTWFDSESYENSRSFAAVVNDSVLLAAVLSHSI